MAVGHTPRSISGYVMVLCRGPALRNRERVHRIASGHPQVGSRGRCQVSDPGAEVGGHEESLATHPADDGGATDSVRQVSRMIPGLAVLVAAGRGAWGNGPARPGVLVGAARLSPSPQPPREEKPQPESCAEPPPGITRLNYSD